jgi:tryptophanyl-tRNA synthetase
MKMSKPVILTGLRTNAEYHLGNYLGALLPMVELQKAHLGEYQVNLFAPDLHSFTGDTDHAKLFAQTMQNLRVFVAAGMPIDNPDFYMYRQSFVPAHSELTVILNNFAYFGELSRMTQFKDKSTRGGTMPLITSGSEADGTPIADVDAMIENLIDGNKNSITAGLFDYPVLMASDILLYGAKYVPVGDDQRQHLELARDLGIRLNNKFGEEIFTVPEEWKKQLEFAQRLEGVRIRSLRNPTAKMSKSVDDPSGTIQLSDTPEEATKKIKTAETDSVGSINWDWENQPGITNLLQIYQLLSGKTQQQVKDEWTGNDRYGDLKAATAEVVANFLASFQSSLASVDEASLMAKLESSERAMNEMANITLQKVQKAVGLRS